MNTIISIIAGVFASVFFDTIFGYIRIFRYLNNSQLLCISWTISAAAAIITYQSLH